MKRLLLILLIPSLAHSATILVGDLSAATVQAAITAAAEGDTLILPSGSSTWTAKVIVTNKSLIIAGVGTVITADPSVSGGTIFSIESCGSKRVDVSGINWIGNTGGYGTVAVGKNVSDQNTNYRLHNMNFTVNYRGILLLGKCEGVIDHCTFRCTLNDSCQGVTVWGDAQYPLVPGDTAASFPPGTAWTTTVTFGDSHRAFIEDCDFNFDYPNDAAVEGYYGAKYCLRHCTFENTAPGNHGLDSGVSSTHSYEVYDNVTTYVAELGTPGFAGVAFEARGGTGVYYNNKAIVPWLNGPNGPAFIAQYGHAIKLECYRATGTSIFNPPHGGFITGSNSYDGNQAGTISDLSAESVNGASPTGWPTIEQVGTTGPITLLSDHSTMTNAPFYEWNNTYGVDACDQAGGSNIILGPNFTNARQSATDLVIDPADNTRVTSASRSFIASDVGSSIAITCGDNFNFGWYRIANVSSGSAILSSGAGVTGSSGGNWCELYTNIPPSDILKSNRDYFQNTMKPDYTPYPYPHP